MAAAFATDYRATITPANGATNVALNLAAGAVTDAAGNGNTAAAQRTVTADGIAPTLAIDAPGAHNGGAFNATFTFGEPVAGFTRDDIDITGGRRGALSEVTGSGIAARTRYRLAVTPLNNRTGVALGALAGVAHDAAGNGNAAAAVTVRADTTRPTLSIEAPAAHNGSAFAATFTFSEAVTGFAAGDIGVTGGTIRNLTGAGATYTATVAPTDGNTRVVLSLAANRVQDVAGNGNTAAPQVTVIADTTAPTLSIAAPAAHNGRSAFVATFTFSEVVSGFDAAADITVAGGTAAAPSVLTGAGITPGTTYRAIITPDTPASGATPADITLDVPAAAARDAAGNDNTAAAQITVSADADRPGVTISADKTAHNGTGSFTATFTFTEAVSGFAVGDIGVSGGTAGGFSGSGDTYTATITPTDGDTDVVLSVAEAVATDGGSNTNLPAIPVTISAGNDSKRPDVSITTGGRTTHNGTGTFTATFTFTEAVSGFVAGDIGLTGGTASGFSGSGDTYTATITPTDSDTDVVLSVAEAVATDPAGNDNTAATAVTVRADTTEPTLTIAAPGAHYGRAFTVTFTFSKPVTDFDPVTDIIVSGGRVTGGRAAAPGRLKTTARAAAPAAIGLATTYRATITPASPASGAITLTVPAAMARDAAGNHSAAAAMTVRASSATPIARRSERGDLALVPYYTVADDRVTGIHIVNTSEHTQVVKIRFRRATDAMDVLDFNLVLSPKDVYAGFLSDDANGTIAWTSPDSTCTAPAAPGNRLEMPAIYRAGAETGYVEIIAMGRPTDETQPIAVAAKHRAPSPSATGASTASTPLDCDAVRSNFFADGKSSATR